MVCLHLGKDIYLPQDRKHVFQVFLKNILINWYQRISFAPPVRPYIAIKSKNVFQGNVTGDAYWPFLTFQQNGVDQI